ncbi:MAG: oligosaccharide flippase family protein [Acidobacteriota bacterium]
MSQIVSDLKRVAGSSGLYAVANMAQRGLSFILLPVYTRFLDPSEYGILELLTGLSAILFGLLLLGMPSALTKVFHRDCEGEEEQKAVLPTALALDLGALLLGGGLLFAFAERVGIWIVGEAGRADVIRLAVATVVVSSLVAIVLSSFRAREQALSYAVLNFVQFGFGMLLNVALVVWFRMGIHGVLWGNLISAVVALPLGMWMARSDLVPRFERRLVRPLLHFGVLVIPTAITGWVITMADRYLLRYFGEASGPLQEALGEVAVYSVGYKIGMVLQMGLVWPFQLAWPAVAFSISKRPEYRSTYARVLTYLVFALTLGVLGLSLVSREGLEAFAGPSYRRAHEVVPWVALAYAFAGVQFCLAPGVHVAKMTKVLPLFSLVGAALNIGLNVLWIPAHGMLGATWATTASYAFLALATALLAQRYHPVDLEVGRLVKVVAAGALVFAVGAGVDLGFGLVAGLTWQLFLVLCGFPALVLSTGFLEPGERRRIGELASRLASWNGGGHEPRNDE